MSPMSLYPACHMYTGLTLAQLLDIFSKSLLALSIVAAPAEEASIFLPLSTPLCPARARALHLLAQQPLELLLRVCSLLLLFDVRLPPLTGAVAAVLVECLLARGDRREEDIARVGDKEREGGVPGVEGVDVFFPE